jgi:hypothetical protein
VKRLAPLVFLFASFAHAEMTSYSCRYDEGEFISFSVDENSKALVVNNGSRGKLDNDRKLEQLSFTLESLDFVIIEHVEGYGADRESYSMHFNDMSSSLSVNSFDEDDKLSARGMIYSGSCKRIQGSKGDPAADTSSAGNKSKKLKLRYSDYPVDDADFYTGSPHEAKLVTEDDRAFQTRIKDAAQKKPNFAGRYRIATWGCGTGCEQGVAVDVKTGKVVWLPVTAYIDALNDPNWGEDTGLESAFNFRLNSRLLSVYAYDMENEDKGSYNEHYYVIGNGKFSLLTQNVNKR